MKWLLFELRNRVFPISHHIPGAPEPLRGNQSELERRLLRRRTAPIITAIVKQHLGVNAIKSLKLVTHGVDSLIAEVDDTWIFKFPNGAGPAANLVKEERVLRFLKGRLSLQIPNLSISQTGHLFSCHRKILGNPVFCENYDAFDDATKDAFAEDLAQFFAELHQIEPAEVADLNVGKFPARMSDEKFAKMQRLLPSNYQQAIGELQARIATENAKKSDDVFGHFDCAGVNMAFDHAAGRLAGVFDFAEATIGDVHKELQNVTKISYACALHVANRYRRLTGRPIDMNRVILFGAECRLPEILFYLNRDGNAALEKFVTWYEKFENDRAAAQRIS